MINDFPLPDRILLKGLNYSVVWFSPVGEDGELVRLFYKDILHVEVCVDRTRPDWISSLWVYASAPPSWMPRAWFEKRRDWFRVLVKEGVRRLRGLPPMPVSCSPSGGGFSMANPT